MCILQLLTVATSARVDTHTHARTRTNKAGHVSRFCSGVQEGGAFSGHKFKLQSAAKILTIVNGKHCILNQSHIPYTRDVLTACSAVVLSAMVQCVNYSQFNIRPFARPSQQPSLHNIQLANWQDDLRAVPTWGQFMARQSWPLIASLSLISLWFPLDLGWHHKTINVVH